MSRFHYFKVAFIVSSITIIAYLLVVGLFDMDVSADFDVWKWLGKSVFVGVASGLILGILNMSFKFFPDKVIKNK
jgi:hypothetical protein